MQKRNLIPTPLLQQAEVPPITIVPLKEIGRFQTLRLVFKLIGFMLGGAWSSSVRHLPAAETARRTHAFLEELGGLWIKAGQILSLRTDLLSPEMVEELSKLSYRAFGFAPAIARQVVAESLGQPLEQVFADFEDHPFAAASISQVHRARLRHNGGWVAVKVQRPGITQIFERDLKLISWLLRLMKRIPAVSFIDWEGMIRELQHIMQEEIDYRYEVSNLRRARKVLKDHKIYVPKVYSQFSGKQIIVMEFVTGVLMSDYLRVERTNPAHLEAWRLENNVKPYRVASRLMRSFYRQLFEDNLFHGDLHPGNIILFRNSRFALIDLGTMGNLESKFVEIYKLQAKAFADHDYSKAADYFLLLADSIPTVDITKFRTETVEQYRAWEARTHLKGLSYLEKSITGGVATEVSQIARKYKVSPTWQLLRVTRSLATLDANLSALLGEANPNKILKRYFREAQSREWQRLRQGIGRQLGSALGELKLMANLTSDGVRRGAIRFEGIQSKVDRFFAIISGVIQLALVIAALIVVYDFIHQHYFGIVASLHSRLGAFGSIAELIPEYPFEFGIVAIAAVIYLIIMVGRIRGIFLREIVRLPNGRLDR